MSKSDRPQIILEPIPSKDAWELEYSNPQLLTLSDEPTQEFRDFMRWLRREQSFDFTGKIVVDLGCGVGRNLNYAVSEYGMTGIGYDISQNAINLARERAESEGLLAEYIQHDLAQQITELPQRASVVIDDTSSHLLDAQAHQNLCAQAAEMLAPGGYIFIRSLVLDGDRNARNMIKQYPGPQENSYVHPQLGVVEYMRDEREMQAVLEPNFTIEHSKKYTGYQRWQSQSYKRRYIIIYAQKRT